MEKEIPTHLMVIYFSNLFHLFHFAAAELLCELELLALQFLVQS